MYLQSPCCLAPLNPHHSIDVLWDSVIFLYTLLSRLSRMVNSLGRGHLRAFQGENAHCTLVWACSSAVWVVRTHRMPFSSHRPTTCLLYDVCCDLLITVPQGSLHGDLNPVKCMSNCGQSQPEWLPLCLSTCLASGLRCHIAIVLCRPYFLSSAALQSFGLTSLPCRTEAPPLLGRLNP